MPRPTRKFEERRTERRFAATNATQQRTLIAQAAARLVAEHGITDWTMAKRKAARELGYDDRTPLPGDDEVEAALNAHHALFGGGEQALTLRAQREEALEWMRALAAFAPRLTGGVAAGWATRDSGIRLELEADDPKSVELALINARAEYRSLQSRADAPVELAVDSSRGGLHLVVRSRDESRHRPRRDRHGREMLRLSADEVAALIASTG
ncbi:MAG: hypothetical protein JSR18_04735 [Proteobacteria bacterium]|nr:hypothetical protein [Pseudomonadota bacterium]